MLRVAILSGWHVHAEGYAQEFNRGSDSTLAAIWDEDAARGKILADQFGVDFEPSLDGLLARADVDAVCVTTPTDRHRDVMVKAANAGKHIFTEKVMALTMADCCDIREAVERNGVTFCISFPHRGFPHNLLAKKAVDEEWLGRITLMRVRNAHNGASGGWLPDHFYHAEHCGGGAMIDLGAHPMYLAAWLMGRPVEITSAFTNVTGHAVEDNAVSVMKYENGAIVVSETGFVSGASPFALELYGTDGSLLIGQGGVRLHTAGQGGECSGWMQPDQLPEALPDPIEQFVRGVLYGETIHYGLNDAILLTEIMEAAYQSHREGKHVSL